MKRWLPLIAIVLLMAIAYFSGLLRYFSVEALKLYRETWLLFVAQHPVSAPLLFVVVYITVTALSLPVGLFLSLLSGFLFDQPWSTVYNVVGATIGAILIFLAAKTALGDCLKKKSGKLLGKIQKGFRRDGVSYLLFLRFVPLFPFWLVNLAPALLNVSLVTFAWTTCVGVIPGAFILAEAGAGLGAILDAPQPGSLHAIFNLKVKIALGALGVLALLPLLWKRVYKHK